jgi:hypothetical protein
MFIPYKIYDDVVFFLLLPSEVFYCHLPLQVCWQTKFEIFLCFPKEKLNTLSSTSFQQFNLALTLLISLVTFNTSLTHTLLFEITFI